MYECIRHNFNENTSVETFNSVKSTAANKSHQEFKIHIQTSVSFGTPMGMTIFLIRIITSLVVIYKPIFKPTVAVLWYYILTISTLSPILKTIQAWSFLPPSASSSWLSTYLIYLTLLGGMHKHWFWDKTLPLSPSLPVSSMSSCSSSQRSYLLMLGLSWWSPYCTANVVHLHKLNIYPSC